MSGKWEYNIVILAMESMARKQQHLTALGSKGWELVSVVEDTFYFKREKPVVIRCQMTLERRPESEATDGK